MLASTPKIYRVTRSSLRDADPPRHLHEDIDVLIPQAGLLPRQVADMILPREDRLWLLLFASGLPDRLCLVFARICALRCLTFWLVPHPAIVVRYLRTGKKALAREAREAVVPLMGDAEKAAAWASTVPFFEGDSINLVLRSWSACIVSERRKVAEMADAWKTVDGEWIHGPYKVKHTTTTRPWMVYYKDKPMRQAHGHFIGFKRFKILGNAILWVDQRIALHGRKK